MQVAYNKLFTNAPPMSFSSNVLSETATRVATDVCILWGERIDVFRSKK
jgi:hypothetical protein